MFVLGLDSSSGVGGFEIVGIFAAAKMAHLSDDETVAKMGHPIPVRSDEGHPASANDQRKSGSRVVRITHVSR
jgi:hypothetical protein